MRHPSAPFSKMFVVRTVAETLCPSTELFKFSYRVTQARLSRISIETWVSRKRMAGVFSKIRCQLSMTALDRAFPRPDLLHFFDIQTFESAIEAFVGFRNFLFFLPHVTSLNYYSCSREKPRQHVD